MEVPQTQQPVFILPNPELPPSQFSHNDFDGMNAAERAVHSEMLYRAHSIWECKGRPDNSQMADWLQAEAEVRGET